MYIWEISDTDAKNEYVFVIEKQISESETIVSNDVVMHLNDDGTYDFVYIDSDGDGLPDVYELELGTDILNPDTDGDGLPDGYEYFTLETNPLKSDTDDNGVLDGNEDFDGDGLINLQEYLLGTNPFAFDTDNDGFSDNYEVTHKMNPLVYNEILTDNSIIADINDNTVNDLEILNMDEYYPLEIEFNDENTQVTSISGVFSDVIVKSPIEAIYSIYNVKSLLGLNNPETELKLSKVSHSNSGETYSFLQYYNGIEVYGSSLTVSVDTNGKVTSLSSSIISANIFENLCLVSNLSETDLQNVIHNEYENSEVISSQKAIYLTNKSSVPQLIYISTISDNGMYFIVFIDANSGNIIEKNDTMLYEMVAASGKNENDDDIKFEVNKTGKIFKKYTLEDINRKVYMYNCNDYNKQYTSKNNEWLDKTANSAYYNIVKVYDWWKRFNYIGLDGNGNNVNVYIHHPHLTNNAGFNPMKFELYFGDSTELLTTLASRLDACGHEYGHAVFTTKANCYVAADVKVKTISEAYADIFGSFVNNNTWTTQKRNIVDPNVTYNPSSTEDYAAIYEAGENGIDLYDPHYESTIISHAAYLMQNDYNIDFDKLSVLWYDSLSEGYDFYSDYNTVRDNVIKSARKNNFTYNEISNIMQAFDDVGIYADKGIAEISVYDGEEPVVDAKITLINYGSSKEIYTDSTGTATFSNQNAGRNTVKIEITGQEPIYTQILIVKDKATKRKINILTSTSNFDWNVYDHYNCSEPYSNTLPKHIVTNDNDIKMIGYSALPLKDFMLTNKNNDDTSFIHSSQKILSFNIKRDSNNWHTMEGGGFLFNVKVDETNLSCHCILITSGGLKLYDIRNVNIDNFRNGDLGDISQVGRLLGTYDIGNVLYSHNITLRITDTVGLSGKTISVWDGDDLIIDNYLLLNSYGEDFGPITSHTRHACSQISYFTFSDIQMSNISQTEIE